ncbi:MAG TPA: GIY-YIG nuclease family protein [Candidatus Peregrinibacteria bacterium]|nr:GIY-YIG nuclease family protein [Candidatus Peregrinibacteria bacterium]
MYTVYILKSKVKERYYIGSTGNLDDRIVRHNQGRNKSTKAHRPWNVALTENYKTKKEALKRERKIKSYKGGEAFKKIIQNAGVV